MLEVDLRWVSSHSMDRRRLILLCREDGTDSHDRWNLVHRHLVHLQLEVGGKTFRALGTLEWSSFGIVDDHVSFESTAQSETSIADRTMVVMSGQGSGNGSIHRSPLLILFDPLTMNYTHTVKERRCRIGFDLFGRWHSIRPTRFFRRMG